MKIVDCFMFFNELELLELRLNYLNSCIDYFIIVEATTTFSGLPKQLYFEENKERYKEFLPKIIHLIIDKEMPNTEDRWTREYFQRRYIINGINLLGLNPKDLILCGDCDEIPRRELIGNSNFSVFHQNNFMYYFNVKRNDCWHGTVEICRWQLQKLDNDLQKVRDIREKIENKIMNGGWHFGWLGDAERAKTKLKSFSHSELDQKKYHDIIEHNIKNRIAPWILSEEKTEVMEVVKIDSSFPDYLVNNLEKFKPFIYNC